ncbi:maturation factor [Boletus edulis]|nr:maturation factor [Boletus edulis]
MSHTVDIPQALKDSLRKFRFARRSQGSAALIVKINKKDLVMEEEDQFDNVSIEELAQELPESSPRYVVLSYELKHKDGRASFPLTKLMTLYASAFLDFQNVADISKVIDIDDGAESLTKETIDAKLLSS